MLKDEYEKNNVRNNQLCNGSTQIRNIKFNLGNLENLNKILVQIIISIVRTKIFIRFIRLARLYVKRRI